MDAVTSHTYACQFLESPLTFAGEMVRKGVGTGEVAKCQRALNPPVGNFSKPDAAERAVARAPPDRPLKKPLRVGTRGKNSKQASKSASWNCSARVYK